jgi:hypothetical protein
VIKSIIKRPPQYVPRRGALHKLQVMAGTRLPPPLPPGPPPPPPLSELPFRPINVHAVEVAVVFEQARIYQPARGARKPDLESLAARLARAWCRLMRRM